MKKESQQPQKPQTKEPYIPVRKPGESLEAYRERRTKTMRDV